MKQEILQRKLRGVCETLLDLLMVGMHILEVLVLKDMPEMKVLVIFMKAIRPVTQTLQLCLVGSHLAGVI